MLDKNDIQCPWVFDVMGVSKGEYIILLQIWTI